MNDVHPLLTLNNLSSIAPDFSLFTYPAWSNSTAYVVGDVVTHDSNIFRCIQAHTNQATTETAYWEAWSANKAFTLWLEQKTDGALSLFLNDWIGRKFQSRSARSLVERERLYTATGDNERLVAKAGGNMVGIEISVFRSMGARAYIREIALHLTNAQSLTVYLYKSGQREPVQSSALTYTNDGSVQWFPVNWELKGEGAYWLCYYENEATGFAYNDAPEKTAWTVGWEMPGGKYFKASPFIVPVEDLSGVGEDEIGTTLIVGDSEYFKTENIAYTSDTYGLNVGLNVQCDLSDFVIEQKQLFAQAFSLFFAKKLLSEMAYNADARVNRNEKNIDRAMVMYELNGEAQNNGFSLSKQYEKALAAIQFDTTEVDNMCLPCAKSRGLSYTTTG